MIEAKDSSTLNIKKGEKWGIKEPSNSCYSISGNEVPFLNLEPQGGIIKVVEGDTSNICVENNTPSSIKFSRDSTNELSYSYVITDQSNLYLGHFTNIDLLSFEDYSSPSINVWGLSHTGNITLQKGDSILKKDISTGCFQLSKNAISLKLNIFRGHTVKTNLITDSLLICTVLYILIALVLTGMVNYSLLKVDDPLAFVFDKIEMHKIGYIISISAVVATTSVLLVFQLGQPRIWMSMSRDGLLPKKFSKVHSKFGTPSFATIVTGVFVGVPSLFMSIGRMTDLTSIGTLFAFVLVCFGVLVLPRISPDVKKKSFQLPYINGQFIIPVLAAIFIYFGLDRISSAFVAIQTEGYQEFLYLIFVFVLIIVAILSFIRKYSVIPIVGAMCCMYLMIEIPPVSWLWFFVWMTIGLVFYSFYGRRKSLLAKEEGVS
mgnify:CR=1 FL=1